MIKIGITGGIGSGKTTAAKIIETHFKIPVFYADKIAKNLMNSNKLLQEKLINKFGNDVIINSKINKTFLSKIVFNEKSGAEMIANIVHPFVHTAFDLWCKLRQGHPIVAIEAAILFERGSHKKLNKTILVVAPKEQRINRVMKRNDCTRQEVLERIEVQWDDKKKIELCDYVVKNHDGENMFSKLGIIIDQLKRKRTQKR